MSKENKPTNRDINAYTTLIKHRERKRERDNEREKEKSYYQRKKLDFTHNQKPTFMCSKFIQAIQQ